MQRRLRLLSREARRHIAYGLYARSAIRRFDREGMQETIRQLKHAPSSDADGERARQVAPAIRVRSFGN